jgi:hypothetical protein
MVLDGLEGMPKTPTGYTTTARFLRHNNHFSVVKRKVKHLSYHPDKQGKLSVFYIDGLDHSQTLDIGIQNVDTNIKGYGVLCSTAFEDHDLTIEFDNNPERHANVSGWPKEKQEYRLIAMELADKAALRLRQEEE